MSETILAPTDAEKLATIERLIEDFRWARPQPEVLEHRTWVVLRAIALEMRAAQPPTVPDPAFQAIGSRIDSARREKQRTGEVSPGHYRAIADAVMGHWGAITDAFRARAKLPEVEAEVEMYQMMAYDIAAPNVIAAVERKFPAIAKSWEKCR